MSHLMPEYRCIFVGFIFWSSYVAWGSNEQQVSFQGTDGVTLAGTLQLPAGEGRSPALVLLAGSGPTDRNGNQPPALITDLQKHIAQGLADQVVVSLRFDKRGMYANAAELPKDNAKLGDFLRGGILWVMLRPHGDFWGSSRDLFRMALVLLANV